MRQVIKKLIPKSLLHYYRLKRYPVYKEVSLQKIETKRLNSLTRFKEGETNLFGKSIRFVDSASFIFMKDEIFNKRIYRFKSNKDNPLILDVGSNIGLSVIYFKRLFPTSKVIAFEPDKKVFKVLQKNINQFGFLNVELHCKGAWNKESKLPFFSEGADGGRLLQQKEKGDIYKIETVRLRSYLNQPVAMLKIDIEGAEIEVLKDCADLLSNVDNIFVEYHSFTDKPQDLHVLLNILQEAGFRYQIQHVGIFSPKPFVIVNNYMGMDLQLNIFGVRS